MVFKKKKPIIPEPDPKTETIEATSEFEDEGDVQEPPKELPKVPEPPKHWVEPLNTLNSHIVWGTGDFDSGNGTLANLAFSSLSQQLKIIEELKGINEAIKELIITIKEIDN